MVAGSGASQPIGFPVSKVGPTQFDLITTAAYLRVGHLIHRRISHHRRLGFHFRSYFKKLAHLSNVPSLKDISSGWSSRSLQLAGFNFLQLSKETLSSACSACLYFFNGGQTGKDFKNEGKSNLKISSRNPLNRRQLTNFLLAVNVLIYLAQVATQGDLLLWGAKINHLIDKGQLRRLVTSSFLHANIGHLMVNCYSLNSVGPAMENISGPWRFLAVYFASAVASSAVSYWLCKAPAVGASGAIFGLVGSFGVFVLRHRGLVGRGKEDLQQLAYVIVLNMVIGLASKGIDNWGHLGGLLGGVATSWLLGPAWKYESASDDGRRVFSDRAPIFYLVGKRK